MEQALHIENPLHTGLANTQLDPERSEIHFSRADSYLSAKLEPSSGCHHPCLSHLYFFFLTHTSAGTTAGRERESPLTGNFTLSLRHVFSPLGSFLHAFLMNCFPTSKSTLSHSTTSRLKARVAQVWRAVRFPRAKRSSTHTWKVVKHSRAEEFFSETYQFYLNSMRKTLAFLAIRVLEQFTCRQRTISQK